MAYTLAEAAEYSKDVLQAGVIELFVKDDPVLEKLPFITIVGNGLTYTIEKTEPDVNFYEVGDTWVESTGTVEQKTAVLRILGGDCDIDNFLKATRSNVNDLKAETIAAKVKAMKKTFAETFVYGYNAGAPKTFDGLHTLISSATYNTIGVATNNTTPVALSMERLEAAIDMVKGAKPELVLMSKQMRRNINKYLVTAGGITYDDFANKRVQTVFDVPVAASDYVKDTENCDKLFGTTYGYEHTTPAAASDASTTIFILSFGPKYLCGTQNGDITIVPIGDLETKDASRWRIKWYCSVMLQSIISCTKLTGIKNDVAAA